MDKIIVVYGDCNVGKTTVINEIYDELYNQKNVVVKKKQVGENPKDFEAVLNFNGKNIAFLSMGDSRETVDEYVNKYNNYDIFITALNKRFKCISSVWLKNSNVIYKVDKTTPDKDDNQQVYDKVMNLIKNKENKYGQ